jgi:hypothetical protein
MISLFLLGAAHLPVHASFTAVFIVTTTADSGAGSLRQARLGSSLCW